MIFFPIQIYQRLNNGAQDPDQRQKCTDIEVKIHVGLTKKRPFLIIKNQAVKHFLPGSVGRQNLVWVPAHLTECSQAVRYRYTVFDANDAFISVKWIRIRIGLVEENPDPSW